MSRDDQITQAECSAIRMLYRDGWSKGELKMTFHLSRTRQVAAHIDGECTHASVASAIASD